MPILARINIGKRILVIGAASLLGLVLVIGLAVWQLDSALRQSFNSRTQQAVEVAYSQLERFHAEEVAGRMTRAQAQEAAKEAIRTMRFGDNDYFFVMSNELTMVMHPVKPALIGKNLADETDADGKHHFREMVDMATRNGAGFVDYNYQPPDKSPAKPKLSYTRKFAPWGWVVATGVFAAEVRGAVMDAAISLGTVVLFVLAGLVALIWVVSRSITLPLQAAIVRMRGLANGDVTSEITGTERRDELGEMAGALRVFRDAEVAKQAAEAAKAQADADQQRIVALLSDKLEGVSAGDLTRDMSESVPESYAALKSNFNTALANLRELVGALANASQSIHTGSNEIASASEDLARRTESNAASLEQSSAALSQMNDRIRSSTAVAEQTAGSAEEAIRIVGTGRATAEEASGAMTRVSDSAKGIDSVIEGLDKIAFQTRVLAMNAAVEAGRAGEAGRGFAVVADLVSALAMRAEEEAKRARDQLTATQSDIVIAVDAVQKVDAALAEITGSVAQVHQYVATMANDNRAQASAIGEISDAVNEMDRSTQQNAAMVEETSAAARNLAGEVETLASQSSRFKVGDTHAPIRTPAKPRPARAAASAPRPAVPAYAHASTSPDGDWASF